uniref:Uncharacterized protein n=1 Tax=Rhizophora mucronata TaxID=61149 RepID=A0A2P2QZB7_RHIMU
MKQRKCFCMITTSALRSDKESSMFFPWTWSFQEMVTLSAS